MWLVSVCLACGLTGCQDQPQTSDSNVIQSQVPVKELTFWTFYNADSPEQKFFSRIAQEYSDQVDHTVHITMKSLSWSDYGTTGLISAFAAGEGPDIFLVAPSNILQYSKVNILKDLTPYLSQDVLGDFLPHSLDATTIDDKIYGIPYEQDLLGLFYDKDVFDAKGLTPPRTWDELLSDAVATKTDHRAGLTFDVGATGFEVFMFSPFLWSAGGDVMTGNHKHSALDSDGTRKALEYYRSLMRSGAINQKLSLDSGEIAILGKEETAMQICGSWAIRTIEEQFPNKNIGVVPIPLPPGGKPTTVAGGWKIVANANSSYAEDAAKFAVWAFANDDIKHSVEWGTQVKFAFPVRRSVLEKAKPIFEKGLRKEFVERMLGTERPELRITPQMANIVAEMIQQAFYKTEMPIDQIVKTSNQKLESYINTYPSSL
ncbi:hypothetical protein A8709_32760 [Paenibacillus pectinilyticus]|uniref:ABC transporter substrate-binding protein n=1 Tax=Paenibacillus pectinilyticus TaxID=512399 RepID=A0A1C0ZWX7_9BACL|nr:sugar ABC transporter substrate-binding protein [Paenibacillus pectinilyticus]OCT12587.1 hypothetical protein A8709_32760 [Paenibacillus pectinilyticus]